MKERTLRSCRILVVEDEYMLAEELRTELLEAGAVVIGPVGTVSEALTLVDHEPEIDGAVLDANLRGEMAFPVADRLRERGVPFVFTTGYDAAAFPSAYQSVTRCEKPVNVAHVARAIGRVIHPGAS